MLTKDIEILCNWGEPRFLLSATTDRVQDLFSFLGRGAGVIVPKWNWKLWDAGVLKVPNGKASDSKHAGPISWRVSKITSEPKPVPSS